MVVLWILALCPHPHHLRRPLKTSSNSKRMEFLLLFACVSSNSQRRAYSEILILIIRITTISFNIPPIYRCGIEPMREQVFKAKPLHVPVLVLARGPAIFGFETARKVGLRGETDGFRRVANRASCQQIYERLGQAEDSDVFRWCTAGQRFELSLQMALAHVHFCCHLFQMEALVVIMLFHYPFKSIDKQV